MTVAVLGLILLLAAGLLTAAVVTSNTSAVQTDLWGLTISNISVGAVFVTGMLTTAVAVAGLLLVMAGVRRGRRLQQERRVLRQENRRLAQQAEPTATTADETRTPRAWRRRREPAATPSDSTAEGTAEPARPEEGDTVDTPSPPTSAADEQNEHLHRPAGANQDRTTSDASS
jgi:hypothetical protein